MAWRPAGAIIPAGLLGDWSCWITIAPARRCGKRQRASVLPWQVIAPALTATGVVAHRRGRAGRRVEWCA
jgi:hypothetical protein